MTGLRAWLDAQDIPDRDASFDDLRAWNATLFDAGWAAPAWPAEFGGRDASLEEQLAYNEAMAGVPGPVNAIGVANIAPAIMTYGTDEQKQRFIRPMLRGDEIWSQGMSEPEAGSDLASLRCAAVRDGDDFVVNGQKTWNSNGHFADWCQLYVRTDPTAKKHAGITCFLGIEAEEETAQPYLDTFGDDNLVFSTDYPHGDSMYPHAVETFDKMPYPDASKVKICGENWSRLYGIPLVKHT